jgi:cbb3-type cytochrome oxidase subunit 3
VGSEIAQIGLLAVAGFLFGGVWSAWKASKRVMAAVLAVAGLLALAGALAWFLS